MSSLCRKKTNTFRARWWIVDFVHAIVWMLLLVAKIILYNLLFYNNLHTHMLNDALSLMQIFKSFWMTMNALFLCTYLYYTYVYSLNYAVLSGFLIRLTQENHNFPHVYPVYNNILYYAILNYDHVKLLNFIFIKL